MTGGIYIQSCNKVVIDGFTCNDQVRVGIEAHDLKEMHLLNYQAKGNPKAASFNNCSNVKVENANIELGTQKNYKLRRTTLALSIKELILKNNI